MLLFAVLSRLRIAERFRLSDNFRPPGFGGKRLAEDDSQSKIAYVALYTTESVGEKSNPNCRGWQFACRLILDERNLNIGAEDAEAC